MGGLLGGGGGGGGEGGAKGTLPPPPLSNHAAPTLFLRLWNTLKQQKNQVTSDHPLYSPVTSFGNSSVSSRKVRDQSRYFNRKITSIPDKEVYYIGIMNFRVNVSPHLNYCYYKIVDLYSVLIL